jgi:stage II sporulation protein R
MLGLNLKRLERSVICALLAAAISACAGDCAAFASECGDIRSRVLRLHIIANSDTAADQALKLRVRDKILEVYGARLGAAADRAAAEAQAKLLLPQMEKTARDEVAAQGYAYSVNAQLKRMYFTTRVYGDVTLPAGDYDAVRITIGKAQGHNWWCVLFPPLCVPASAGSAKLESVLTPEETQAVTGGGQKYVIRFRLLELFESLRGRLGLAE